MGVRKFIFIARKGNKNNRGPEKGERERKNDT